LAKRDLLIILAAVFLLRLPFLNEAVQGDESTFLASAAHAQIDPLHPNRTHYIFTFVERDVDLQGGSHMPMDAWVLAALIAIFGDVKEVPFHAAYIVFSLMAAFAMYSLARRFSPQPLWATLLFLAVPAFVVNGASFEADVPHLAFFLCGIAAFISAVDRRSLAWLAVSAFFLGCAALTVMQAQIAAPILLAYIWLYAPDWKPGWLAAFSPCVALAAWEIFERVTSGVFPFALTARYVNEQGWDRIAPKFLNAAGLLMHLWFIVFPPLFAIGLWAAWRRRDRDTAFIAAWFGIYLAAACALFFSGSARYLLPVAAPVAIWASYAPGSWLTAGFAVQMALSICLAIANHQHWSAYREFARQVVRQAGGHRLWINSEWGLRHYMEDAGARVVLPGQLIPSGDVVVSSELVHPVTVARHGQLVASFLEKDVRPSMPFRLIGLESRSGYSSIDRGFLPFGIGTDLVDRIHADIHKEVKPTLTNLPMNAPEADTQIVSGIYNLEQGKLRWTSGAATVVLVSPSDRARSAEPLHAAFYIPDNAPARHVVVTLDGRKVYSQAVTPGMQRIVTPPQQAAGPTSIVSLQLDHTFSPPNDSRELGVFLQEVGWGK
jgi:Dolichyl-phosphate-mannose-protein mannosyltransferase